MTTVYIVQNETHLTNFISISKNDSDIFIVTDLYCGFEIPLKHINDINKRSYRIPKGDGIYRVGLFSRLIELIKFRPSDIDLLVENKVSKLVIGNDGAVQKKIYHYLKSKNSQLRVELWSDGLLEKVNKKNFRGLINLFEPISHKFQFDCYLPSISCTSSMLDTIFVMSDSCLKSVKKNGFKGDEIKVTEFPRHINLKQIKRTTLCKRILVVVSAFSWHGRDDIEKWEIQLVESLVEISAKITNFELAIRPHPRSSEALKNAIEISKLKSTIDNCEFDIVNSDVVISYASTCLFDAYAVGKEVLVYEQGAPQISRGDFIESLKILKDLSTLIHYFEN